MRVSKQIKVNLPEDIKDWLQEESKRNLRSQTAEIVLALREKKSRSIEEKKADAAA